jgi:hypothetical protein
MQHHHATKSTAAPAVLTYPSSHQAIACVDHGSPSTKRSTAPPTGFHPNEACGLYDVRWAPPPHSARPVRGAGVDIHGRALSRLPPAASSHRYVLTRVSKSSTRTYARDLAGPIACSACLPGYWTKRPHRLNGQSTAIRAASLELKPAMSESARPVPPEP